MAKQTINIGASANDGTGTPLRTSFDYCNLNFTELYTALGGGVGLPGATTQVIFNDGGTNLAGDAGLVYNKATDALTVAGLVTAGSATITGDLTAARLIVTGGTIPANGLWLPTTNTLEFAANSLAQYRIAPLGVFSWYDGAGGTRMTLNATGLGIGTTSGPSRLCIGSTADTSATENALLVSTNKATFNIVADGATNAAGTAFTYSWANGGQGPLAFKNATGEVARFDAVGNFIPILQATAPSLGTNSQMVFNLTSNTNLRISVRGTDGTTRTANITLA